MQDKIDCNKINKTRKERNANSIYTGRPLPVPTSNPQAIHLRFFTIFVKLHFTISEHPRNPFPLCSGNSQFKRQPVS